MRQAGRHHHHHRFVTTGLDFEPDRSSLDIFVPKILCQKSVLQFYHEGVQAIKSSRLIFWKLPFPAPTPFPTHTQPKSSTPKN